MTDDLATPRALNHIGITVPDIHAAIDWYGKVFGFRRIMGPRRLEPKLSDTAESDIDRLVARIVAEGGKQRTDVWAFVPGTDRKLCYCEDPFGNVIEIFSHSYEQTFANWPDEGRDAD